MRPRRLVARRTPARARGCRWWWRYLRTRVIRNGIDRGWRDDSLMLLREGLRRRCGRQRARRWPRLAVLTRWLAIGPMTEGDAVGKEARVVSPSLFVSDRIRGRNGGWRNDLG